MPTKWVICPKKEVCIKNDRRRSAPVFAELRGLSTKDAKASVKHWLQRLDMMDWARKKVEEISKGMAQKVQFVSCVLHNPQLLILDEPFSGFDPVNADLIKDLIIELKNQGTSIIFRPTEWIMWRVFVIIWPSSIKAKKCWTEGERNPQKIRNRCL